MANIFVKIMVIHVSLCDWSDNCINIINNGGGAY